jgi:hypothetical protein
VYILIESIVRGCVVNVISKSTAMMRFSPIAGRTSRLGAIFVASLPLTVQHHTHRRWPTLLRAFALVGKESHTPRVYEMTMKLQTLPGTIAPPPQCGDVRMQFSTNGCTQYPLLVMPVD